MRKSVALDKVLFIFSDDFLSSFEFEDLFIPYNLSRIKRVNLEQTVFKDTGFEIEQRPFVFNKEILGSGRVILGNSSVVSFLKTLLEKTELRAVLDYEKINPSKYKVKVSGRESCFLTFKMSRSRFWHLGEHRSVQGDYYSNLYFLKEGVFDGFLLHKPNWLYRSCLFFSAISLTGLGVGLLLYGFIFKLRSLKNLFQR
jgi:hypothetical protein